MKRTRNIPVMIFLLVAAMASPAFAQFDDTHVFPWFIDGTQGIPGIDAYFKSTIYIRPFFSSTPITCSLNLRNMTAQFESGASGSQFTINVPANGFVIARTRGVQQFQGGFATLTCSDYVYAVEIFGYYWANGVKIGEATVFSSDDSYITEFILDQTEGAKLGVALANDTDLARVFEFTVTGSFGTRTGTFIVGPRQARAAFIGDIVSNIPANATGLVSIETTDFTL